MGWTHTRSQLARTLKTDPHADVSDLRALMRAQLLAERIQADIDAQPPLSPDQREHLASLLRASVAS